MASKWKAVTQIARILAGIGAGYLIYWQWSLIRQNDPDYYAVSAGIVVAIMIIVLLKKLNKGEG